MAKSLTPEQCEAFWIEADKDESGQLSIQEMKTALKAYGAGNMTDADIAKLFSEIDHSGDKAICKKEFIDEMLKLPKKSDVLKKMFKEYDVDENGTLSKEEARKLILSSGCGYTEEVADMIIAQVDVSGDGLISYSEFEKAC